MNGLHDVYNIIDSTAPLSFGGTTDTLPTQAKLSKKRKMPPECGEPNQAGSAAPPPAPGLSPRVPAGMPVDSRAKDELLAAAVAAAAARHSQVVQQVAARARAQLLILLQQQQGGSGATEDVSRRR